MCSPIAFVAASTAVSAGMSIVGARQTAQIANAQLKASFQAQQASINQQNLAMMQTRRQTEAANALQRRQSEAQMAQQRALQSQAFSNQITLQNAQFARQTQQTISNQQLQRQLQTQELEQARQLQRQQQELQMLQTEKQIKFRTDQAAAQRNLQIEQANAALINSYNQARQQVENQRKSLLAKNEADRLAYQRTRETADRQVLNNNEAANRVYVSEQEKLSEARKAAAFEQQSILAKSIGDKGAILASGRTGQSIGLLLLDVERQAGFKTAQEVAMLESEENAVSIGMESAFLQNISANNQAESSVGYQPGEPLLPEMPDLPTFVGLAIPTNE